MGVNGNGGIAIEFCLFLLSYHVFSWFLIIKFHLIIKRESFILNLDRTRNRESHVFVRDVGIVSSETCAFVDT